jgi:hypothetical protein
MALWLFVEKLMFNKHMSKRKHQSLHFGYLLAVVAISLLLPALTRAGGPPVPFIGTVSPAPGASGYVTQYYTIDVNAHCTTGPANQDVPLQAANFGSTLVGTHTFNFYNDDYGTVYYRLDGGPEHLHISCPSSNSTRNLAGTATAKLDLASPVIAISYPKSGQIITAGSTVHVTGTASDDVSGISFVWEQDTQVPVVAGQFAFDQKIPPGTTGTWTFGAWGSDAAYHVTYATDVTTKIVPPSAAAAPASANVTSPAVITTPTPAPSSLPTVPAASRTPSASPAAKTATQVAGDSMKAVAGYGLAVAVVLGLIAWFGRHPISRWLRRPPTV